MGKRHRPFRWVSVQKAKEQTATRQMTSTTFGCRKLTEVQSATVRKSVPMPTTMPTAKASKAGPMAAPVLCAPDGTTAP